MKKEEARGSRDPRESATPEDLWRGGRGRKKRWQEAPWSRGCGGGGGYPGVGTLGRGGGFALTLTRAFDGHFLYIISTLLDISRVPALWRCIIQPTFGSTTV